MSPSKLAYRTDRIREFLRDHLGKEVRHLYPLQGGDWSSAYAFQTEEGDSVIRFARDREAFEIDRIAAGFASIDLPIPRVEAIGEAFGGYFAISQRAYGAMLDDLDREAVCRVLPALFRMLDAIRRVDLSSTRGFGGWDSSGTAPYTTWRDYLLEIGNDPPDLYCHGWRASLAGSPIGDAAFNEAFQRLEQLADEPPEGRHLVHGDLYCRNLLVSEDRISALIDWQCSVYGDFLYDIALLAYGAPWFPAMEGIDWAVEARAHFASIGLDVPKLEERLRCCMIHVGLGAQQYTVYRKQWDEVEMHARRTLELARAG
jgi:hygromycin-B 4-O-kinase